ncbi:MAG: hypothetical protein LBI02_01000 [Opitutaceae bacterium]|nr:hypothetical protein [Opitutaceae bacterium]
MKTCLPVSMDTRMTGWKAGAVDNPNAAAETEEARRLLQTAGSLRGALEMLVAQFSVLQTRAHLLLTVATLALTITGFSGPKIAAAGAFQRHGMAAGLVLVLVSMLLILWGSLRIRWVTQFSGENDEALLGKILRYRNAKTRLFFAELCLLVSGLTAYVAAVVGYFLLGAP